MKIINKKYYIKPLFRGFSIDMLFFYLYIKLYTLIIKGNTL